MRKAVRAIIVRDGQALVMHRDKFGHEYYTLLGGGMRGGEAAEDALRRELAEESGFSLTSGRLVFIEEAGDPYGTQYIYLCETQGATPKLAENSPEAGLMPFGNKHTPMWLSLEEFPKVEFRSKVLQQAIMFGLKYGFPKDPVALDREYLDQVQSNVAKKG
jgi:8-oxo-dGTP diphosphatase